MPKQNRQKRAVTRIRSVKSKLDEDSTREHLQIFLTEYFLCEMSCKEMIVGFKDDIGEPIEYKDVSMYMVDIRRALNHYGIEITKELRNCLFSKDANSAKSIRDSLVHGISKNNLDKVNRYFAQLTADMKAFLEVVEGSL